MLANHAISQAVAEPDVYAELARLNEDYTDLLNRYDIFVRALHNPKISPTVFRFYLSLIDTYPQLLEGKRAEIEVYRVRANAGEGKESSATRFFQDLSAIQVIDYASGYDRASGERRSTVTPKEGFEYPENFDTNSSERKRKAREAEEKRRKQFQDPRKLMQCPECGSEDLLFDVVAHCRCGYIAPAIRDIPASEIIIEAEVIEIEDDPFAETAKLPAIRPAGVEISQGELAQMEQMMLDRKDLTGLARPDEPCLKCGRARKICHENSEGTWWYSCTPEMWRAYEESKK